MEYTREKAERIVIGTLLNEFGRDDFLHRYSVILRKELFKDKRNSFIYDIISRMRESGMRQTTPYDVLCYVRDNGIPYGDTANFLTYMNELADNYCFTEFKKYVKILVDSYLKEVRYGKS